MLWRVTWRPSPRRLWCDKCCVVRIEGNVHENCCSDGRALETERGLAHRVDGIGNACTRVAGLLLVDTQWSFSLCVSCALQSDDAYMQLVHGCAFVCPFGHRTHVQMCPTQLEGCVVPCLTCMMMYEPFDASLPCSSLSTLLAATAFM